MQLRSIVYAEPPVRMRWLITLLSMAAVLVVAFFDYRLGMEISLIGVHLLPVLLAAWLGVAGGGYGTAVFAMLSQIGVDRLGGTLYSSPFYSYLDSLANGVTLVVAGALASLLRERLRIERRISRVDSLTGALTRQTFRQALAEEWVRGRRLGHDLALVYMDLDGFKELNDTRGHQSGDRALLAFMESLRGQVREIDQVGRLGGDEFCLLLPEAGTGEAVKVVQRLRRHSQANDSMLDFSAGVVVFERDVGNWGTPTQFVDRALEWADQQMYAAKQSGKGNVGLAVWRDGRLLSQKPADPLSLSPTEANCAPTREEPEMA